MQAGPHVLAIWARAPDLHWAEPGDDGAEGGAGAAAEQVCLRAVAEVPACARVPSHHRAWLRHASGGHKAVNLWPMSINAELICT